MYCPLAISKPDTAFQSVQNPLINKCFILQNCSSSSIHCSLFHLAASQCIQKNTSCMDYVQYTGGYVAGWRVLSIEEHAISISVSKTHIFSASEVYSTDRSDHQYCGGYAKWISYIVSMDESVRYRTTKTAQGGCWWFYLIGRMIFYRQSNSDLDFVVLLLYSDLDEIPLVC